MSEENKNVQETKDDKKEGNVLAGFVLYTDANMDWLRFKKFLKDDWNIVPQDDVKDNAMVFKVGDMVVACSLMPNPVPNKEAENAAKYNILWKEGANEVAKHQAHVMLAVMNKTSAVEQADMNKLEFTLTVAEDLDCSGLPDLGHVVCTYDEGFISGLFKSFTGKSFEAKEVDCWCTGDRTCRFEVKPATE